MDTTNNNSVQWMTIQPFKNKHFNNFVKVTQNEPVQESPPTQESQQENEESMEDYTCYMCSKTFYNMNALKNHKKIQHDIDSDSDMYYPKFTKLTDFSINGLCGFKFVPLQPEQPEASKIVTEKHGLVIRLFEQDTTYIVFKVEHSLGEIEAAKRQRLEVVLKKAKMKPGKQPIDVRGPFTCTFPISQKSEMKCRQIFFNCCAFSLHYRDYHTNRRKSTFRCQVCEKRLDDTVALDTCAENDEETSEEVERPMYTCVICKKTFSNKLCYDQHNKFMHTKNKTHQCNICMKWFTQYNGLQQHMRIHNGTRLHTCQYCSKPFAQKSGLEQHLRIHTKVKPFICIVCSKPFSQSVHLRQHMRTHTNIQPFECMLCDRRFKQSSHLKFHIKSHHIKDGGHPVSSPPAVKSENNIHILSWPNLQQQIEYDKYYNSNLPPTQEPEQFPQPPFEFQNAEPASMMIL